MGITAKSFGKTKSIFIKLGITKTVKKASAKVKNTEIKKWFYSHLVQW